MFIYSIETYAEVTLPLEVPERRFWRVEEYPQHMFVWRYKKIIDILEKNVEI